MGVAIKKSMESLLINNHSNIFYDQRYVIKFVSDLRQVGGFSPGTPVSSTHKTDCHDIAEILLKVALYTFSMTPSLYEDMVQLIW